MSFRLRDLYQNAAERNLARPKMIESTPTSFPTLRAAATAPDRFDSAVEIVRRALEAGSIRNIELQDAKAVLGRAVERGWRNAVSEPFFYAGRYQAQPAAVYAFYSSFLVSNLHDLLATSRKLSRSSLDGPAMDAMRSFVVEALPLAEAVTSLKSKVVKGRASSGAPAKPQNPNKIVKTCPCCFRAIAVVDGRMAHHGYQRPYGMSFQTASCAGVRFPPLEVSDKGLVWLIGAVEADCERLQAKIENADALKSLPLRLMSSTTEQLTPIDPRWPRTLARHKGALATQLAAATAGLSPLRERLATWTPKP